MNRIDICKNIIQSINKYITNPDILEAHREENHFIRKRKLSMFQIILYLLYSSKTSMFQNLSAIRDELPCLDFPSVCIFRSSRTICTEIQSHFNGLTEPPLRKMSHPSKSIL